MSEVQILTKEQLIEEAIRDRQPEPVNGVMVRKLSGVQHQAMHALKTSLVQNPPKKQPSGEIDDQAMEERFQIETDLSYLVMGVVDPVLTREEWRQVMTEGSDSYVRPIINKIKELSGTIPLERLLAAVEGHSSATPTDSGS